jgi:hypothetical protein
MEIKEIIPIVLYDDRCYLCIKFAEIVGRLGRKKVFLVGHYSQLGEKLRAKFLDSSALSMFWFIDEDMAYGGRAALVPLLRTILSSKAKIPKNHHPHIDESCDVQCKTAKAVFVRSASIILNSKKIPISL